MPDEPLVTISAGRAGVQEILVRRDTPGGSAEMGLDLLRRLLPAIRLLDEAAAQPSTS